MDIHGLKSQRTLWVTLMIVGVVGVISGLLFYKHQKRFAPTNSPFIGPESIDRLSGNNVTNEDNELSYEGAVDHYGTSTSTTIERTKRLQNPKGAHSGIVSLNDRSGSQSPDRQVARPSPTIVSTKRITDGKALRDEGLKLTRKGKAREAIKKFSEAIAVNPNDLFSYINRGYTKFNYNIGDPIPDFRKVLELDPNYSSAHAALGRALVRKVQYSRAFSDVPPVDDYELLNEALNHFNLSLQISVNNKGGQYVARSHVLHLLGKPKMANKDKVLALKSELKPYLVHWRLGKLHLDFKEYENAISELTQSIKHKPNWRYSLGARGLARLSLRDLDGAISDLEKAVNRTDLDALDFYNLACGYSLRSKSLEGKEKDTMFLKAFWALEYFVGAVKFKGVYEKYYEHALKDTDLDPIRNDPRFKKLFPE